VYHRSFVLLGWTSQSKIASKTITGNYAIYACILSTTKVKQQRLNARKCNF